jgi:CheY-like chemotaxis protein
VKRPHATRPEPAGGANTRRGDLTTPPAIELPSGGLDRAADDLVALRINELRPPLASMIGFAELIDSNDLTDEQRHLYSGILLREGRRLTALVNNALALQSLESGHRTLNLAPVDIRSLILRAVVVAGADDRRPITMDVPENLPLVSADAESILEVLANFLSNARRFSPDGGVIKIGARVTGEKVEINIRDHGVGIEASALPSLFRKFYRANNGVRRLGPGAGLGLAINHRIVEGHGGTLDAASKGLGKGARFAFTLPICQAGERTGDVLIIEDDAAFASVMKAEFEALGFITIRAADAETAERLLATLTPRAIILDLLLPGLQGEDFLARMVAAGGAHPVTVVLTAKHMGPTEISQFEAAGVLATLPKEAGAPQAAVALIADALALEGAVG